MWQTQPTVFDLVIKLENWQTINTKNEKNQEMKNEKRENQHRQKNENMFFVEKYNEICTADADNVHFLLYTRLVEVGIALIALSSHATLTCSKQNNLFLGTEQNRETYQTCMQEPYHWRE